MRARLAGIVAAALILVGITAAPAHANSCIGPLCIGGQVDMGVDSDRYVTAYMEIDQYGRPYGHYVRLHPGERSRKRGIFDVDGITWKASCRLWLPDPMLGRVYPGFKVLPDGRHFAKIASYVHWTGVELDC